MKQNFNGHFLDAILALMEDTYAYEASFMNEAISVIEFNSVKYKYLTLFYELKF